MLYLILVLQLYVLYVDRVQLYVHCVEVKVFLYHTQTAHSLSLPLTSTQLVCLSHTQTSLCHKNTCFNQVASKDNINLHVGLNVKSQRSNVTKI